jgi:hypothetical protein
VKKTKSFLLEIWTWIYWFICSFTDRYFAGETFDRNHQLPNGTYEISIRRRYDVRDFINFTGQLSFQCHLVILMTSWRMGINYKLFGDSGCITDPPKINNGNSNYHHLFANIDSFFLCSIQKTEYWWNLTPINQTTLWLI